MGLFTDMAAQWMRENIHAPISPPTTKEAKDAKDANANPSIDAHDPSAWTDAFHQWTQLHCLHRAGYDDWGGVGALHVEFSEWAVVSGSVPCTRRTFEALLCLAGYRVENGMVLGLVLKADMWAWRACRRGGRFEFLARGTEDRRPGCLRNFASFDRRFYE